MIHVVGLLIRIGYVVAPLVAAVVMWRAGRRQPRGPAVQMIGLVALAIWAAVLGAGVALAYATAEGGRIALGQLLLAGYFTLGLLLILRGWNRLLT